MDKRQLFISIAKSHIGEDRSWACRVTGYGSGPWCAAFVWACAIESGIQNVIMKCCPSSSLTMQGSTDAKMGQWLPGPASGGNPTPQPGDLYSLYYGDSGPSRSEFWSGHIGIVIGVTDSHIERIDGNFSGVVYHSTLARSDSRIRGYFRPDWRRVGVEGVYADLSGNYTYTGVNGISQYQTTFNSTDAMMREVAYINSDGEPSIKSTDVKLSVVNYTQGLSDIVNVVAPTYRGTYSSDTPVIADGDTSGLNNVQKKIIQFFCSKGCQVSAGVAVCANVYRESSCRPGVDGPDGDAWSAGLCQWRGDRRTKMIQFVGSGWKTDVDGQLRYLWYELEHGYSPTRNALILATNTLSSAHHVVEVFVKDYERPGDISGEIQKRKDHASELWKKLYEGVT